MTDSHAEHGGAHPHPNYILVFIGLLILTTISFFMSEALSSRLQTWLLVLALASTKTLLVGMFFMHLKFEGRWKYVLLVPPAILAVVLLLALMPDIGIGGLERVTGR